MFSDTHIPLYAKAQKWNTLGAHSQIANAKLPIPDPIFLKSTFDHDVAFLTERRKA